MNAISLYVSASRLLFNQSDSDNANYSDLYRLVPYLRQSLSCTVCANLLVEPYSPEVCQHHVCRQCIGGRKNLKPTCSSCRTYHNYHANTQLRILLQCYKSLCNYILATPNVYSSMHKYVHVDAIANGTTEVPQNLAELIDEGAQFHDEYKSNSGLPKSKISILPCIFTSAPSSVSTSQNPSGSSLINTKKTTFKKTTPSLTPAATNDKSSFVHTSSVQHQPICITSVASSSSAATAKVSSSSPSVAALPMQSTLKSSDIAISVFNNPTITKNTPIKTVSNGSAMYSVLYTGSGSKITIKRKTDDNVFTTANTISTKEVLDILSRNPAKITQHPQIQHMQTQKQTVKTIAQPSPMVPAPKIIQPQTSSQMTGYINTLPSTQNFKKPAFALKPNKTLLKRKGCRCGNATPTPGKLTCCGQRCPCYVESKSCVDCKCRGCRNPHRLDGLKVRPQIPQLACLVQMNNQSFEKKYIDIPIESFNTTNSYGVSTEPTIKQEVIPISNHQVIPGSSRQFLATNINSNQNSQMDLSRTNENIEYISNDMDDDNIQVVNVYTTHHMPEISTTLPTIIMQDEASAMRNSTPTNDLAMHNHLSLPSDSQYSLIGEDLIKHSFSDEDDDTSGDEQSDVEIDL